MSAARRFQRVPLWGILVLALAGVGGAAVWSRLAGGAGAAGPPVLAQVPDFALTNRDGRTVTRADLAGRPWVADFVFTRCAASCPRTTERMASLGQGRQAPPFLRVSFTVDPEHDTPEVLARYAEAYAAPDDWLFLTGPAAEIYPLVRRGFLLAVEPSPPPGTASAEEPILHSNRFVLVDGAGRIRGYYDAFDKEAMDRLRQDAGALGREG
ncbi:MAG TPA: SCO family protein [Thermoanaerobaculia bacterium]|nr:SCO family protein [Thermoanaerobaculia bacterium]